MTSPEVNKHPFPLVPLHPGYCVARDMMNLKDYDVRYQRARARWSNLNSRMNSVTRSMSHDGDSTITITATTTAASKKINLADTVRTSQGHEYHVTGEGRDTEEDDDEVLDRELLIPTTKCRLTLRY